MKLILKKTLDLSRCPDALVAMNGSIWIAGGKSGKLQRYSVKSTTGIQEDSVLSGIAHIDGGITKRGDKILAATAKERILSSIDLVSGEQREILDLKTLHGGNNTGGIRAKNSSVTDITWHGNTLWLAVEAGYSSCIIEIDVDKKKIVRDFWSPGPMPRGLEFDNDGQRLWVLEGRKNSLVDLDKNGKWLGQEEKLPLPAVRHLSIDSDNNIWTADAKNARVYCIEREE